MKVKELIERLNMGNPDSNIGFAYPAHDYCHHTIVSDITFVDNSRMTGYSPYFGSHVLVKNEDDYD